MNDFWRITIPSIRLILVLIGLLQLNLIFSWSVNDEGISQLRFKERVVKNPQEALSSWHDDIEEAYHCCVQGHVVSLLLGNYGLSCHTSPEREEPKMSSELQLKKSLHTRAVEVLPCNRHNSWTKKTIHQRMLAEERGSSSSGNNLANKGQDDNSDIQSSTPHQHRAIHQPPSPLSDQIVDRPPPPAPPPQGQNIPAPKRPPPSPTSISNGIPPFSSKSSPSPPLADKKKSTNPLPIALGAMSGSIVLALVIVGIYLWRSNKITVVGPWRTGLTGQLQKALVTGISNLKRSELEAACENFSNVVGSSSIGTIYKGTLSNGVEIAVISLAVTSAKDWSRNLEAQFRRKIETLSKVNHKNFVNLVGYCEEEEPFTRMMVFEYAPNGSVFEHLHVKEAEHLDWGMRLRITMGMAYALEHMHQLVPPVIHQNLNSSAVSLSEDYAAKLCDFCFWNEVAAAQVQPIGVGSPSTLSASPESNVYSFGLVLLEMMTGRILLSMDNSSLEEWVLDYLRGEQHLQELVDPMLRHFNLEQLERLSEVIRKCLHVDPMHRPTIIDVAATVREITGVNRDKAYPRLSPLWWAELEVPSVNGD